MDFDISDSNKISKAINFIFGIFSYVSKNLKNLHLQHLRFFLLLESGRNFINRMLDQRSET